MIAINKSKLPKNIWPIVDEVKNTFDSFKKRYIPLTLCLMKMKFLGLLN
jgi:hypothetical protein